MSVCIFAGPTLPPQDAARAYDATWLPPAKHGDVYRAVSLLRPRAIGIVDGYFQWVPSVWHKEILWAIQQGVHVFGAASMGALRAAELAPFGMRGVGRIFEAYRTGVLASCGDDPFDDDDEVAVVHGPEESGYLALSEAMVNIRYTLAEAGRAQVIESATHTALVALAKGMYFAHRGYESLLKLARIQGLPESCLAALQHWLSSGRVNLKRMDAMAMIAAIDEFITADPPAAQANFIFENTTLWDSAMSALQPASAHHPDSGAVLAELRLDGDRFQMLRIAVLKELLAPEGEASGAIMPDGQSNVPHDLDALAREKFAQCASDRIPQMVLEKHILARLRAIGDYGNLLARAQAKARSIAANSDFPRADDFTELQLLQLRDWYFSKVLGVDMPYDFDDYLRNAGYIDAAQFHTALLVEYVYRQQLASDAAANGMLKLLWIPLSDDGRVFC